MRTEQEKQEENRILLKAEEMGVQSLSPQEFEKLESAIHWMREARRLNKPEKESVPLDAPVIAEIGDLYDFLERKGFTFLLNKRPMKAEHAGSDKTFEELFEEYGKEQRIKENRLWIEEIISAPSGVNIKAISEKQINNRIANLSL